MFPDVLLGYSLLTARHSTLLFRKDTGYHSPMTIPWLDSVCDPSQKDLGTERDFQCWREVSHTLIFLWAFCLKWMKGVRRRGGNEARGIFDLHDLFLSFILQTKTSPGMPGHSSLGSRSSAVI